MGTRPKLGRGSRSDTAVDEYRNTFKIVWQGIKLSDKKEELVPLPGRITIVCHRLY